MAPKENSEKDQDKKQESRLYSYHTFVFPFLFDDGGKRSREEFQNCLSSFWKTDDAAASSAQDYGQFQYFIPSARKLVDPKGEKGAYVINYRYDCGKSPLFGLNDDTWLENPKNADNKALYCIQKQLDGIDLSYTLQINAIRLKLFSSGVGMLIFELENYYYPLQKAICHINEFGRRLFMPYYSYKQEDGSVECILCADSIKVGKCEAKLIEQPTSRKAELPAPIIELLSNENYGIACYDDQAEDSEKIYYKIEPIIDDRMFTICFYRGAELAKKAAEFTDGEYRYLRDALQKRTDDKDNVAQQVYELVFVDGDGSTCQNRTMLRRDLENHVYVRWLENYFKGSSSGSLIGFSEYSMVMISGTPIGCDDFLTVPFLTMYQEMVYITLAQRATLIAFQNMIADCAAGNSKRKIQTILQAFNEFQSNLLLLEVTPQQQGLELYDCLQKHMFIRDRADRVKNLIDSLADFESAENEKWENRILFFLAILGVFNAVEVFFHPFGLGQLNLITWIAAIGLIAFFGVVYFMRKMK